MVTGRGKGFCVGGDSQALSGHADRGAYDPGISADIAKPGFGTDANFDASFAYHFGLNKPVIAAMNGPAAGVGLALACFADLRFAVPGREIYHRPRQAKSAGGIRAVVDAAKNCRAGSC